MRENRDNICKIFISPKDGEVAVAFGSPVMGFESVDQFEDWLNEILSEIPDMRMAMVGEKHPIPRDYAMDVMKEYHQSLLTDTLKDIKDKKEETE